MIRKPIAKRTLDGMLFELLGTTNGRKGTVWYFHGVDQQKRRWWHFKPRFKRNNVMWSTVDCRDFEWI